jgi:hypothetical protein
LTGISLSAPVVCPLKLDSDYMAFLESNGLSANTTNALRYCLHFQVMTVFNDAIWMCVGTKGMSDAHKAAYRTHMVTVHADAAARATSKGSLPALPAGNVFHEEGKDDPFTFVISSPDVTHEHITFIRLLFPKAFWYMMDLTTAWQVKSLRGRNIDNYFASHQLLVNPESIMRDIHYFASKLPKLISRADMLARLDKNAWLIYHTTATSSPALILKLIVALKSFAMTDTQINSFLQDNALTVVTAAARAPWDQVLASRITASTIAKTAVYLAAAKKLPDNWYQGRKALDSLSPAQITALTAIFEKLIAISSNLAAISGATTLTELTARLI